MHVCSLGSYQIMTKTTAYKLHSPFQPSHLMLNCLTLLVFSSQWTVSKSMRAAVQFQSCPPVLTVQYQPFYCLLMDWNQI